MATFPIRKQMSQWNFHRGDIDLNSEMSGLNMNDDMSGLNMNDMGSLMMGSSEMGDPDPWDYGTLASGGSTSTVTGANGQPIIVNVPANSNGNAPYWWDGVISLVSQGVTAFSGAHNGTQVVSSGDRITAITNPVPVAGQPGYINTADPAYQAYLINQQRSALSSPGTGIDGVLAWATQPQNLVFIAIGVGVLFLWNRDPNKKR